MSKDCKLLCWEPSGFQPSSWTRAQPVVIFLRLSCLLQALSVKSQPSDLPSIRACLNSVASLTCHLAKPSAGPGTTYPRLCEQQSSTFHKSCGHWAWPSCCLLHFCLILVTFFLYFRPSLLLVYLWLIPRPFSDFTMWTFVFSHDSFFPVSTSSYFGKFQPEALCCGSFAISDAWWESQCVRHTLRDRFHSTHLWFSHTLGRTALLLCRELWD